MKYGFQLMCTSINTVAVISDHDGHQLQGLVSYVPFALSFFIVA